MNQNTEQVSQNKGLNEFERAKVYYTKKVADNLLYIANPSNKVEAPFSAIKRRNCFRNRSKFELHE
ncbi:hypothetical protein BB423_07555 [Helicobacter pylori]|uniref:hypothetical protein n=1 Tax=Helicobacter pylori TaxID=210 RepID=UPI000BE957FC|nr:hypothetical protein [Helicobacter pylori]PDW36696.1 hypothetical protein BB423_07555 [Helicobacter pylori]WQU64627.1 hypothetical protein KVC19_04455 [Helicobacter pylori]